MLLGGRPRSATYLLLPLLIGVAVHAQDNLLAERHLDALGAEGPPGDLLERDFGVDEYDDELYERDLDLEERADPDCDKRAQPVVVYVTVTIDEQGEPITQTVTQTSVVAAGPTTVAGGAAGAPPAAGGGTAVDPGTITSTVSATRTNRPTVTKTEGGAGGSPPEETEPPTDDWNDWDEDEGESFGSASASASSTAGACTDCQGEEGGSSAAHLKIKTLPITLSIAICVATSIVAGIFVTQ